MPRIEVDALLAFARLGWRRAGADRLSSIGALLLYWLILLIFWGLWRATPLNELAAAHVSQSDLFWYLVITECITLAVGTPYRQVEAEISSGDIASGFMRPIPYALATLVEWSGYTCYRGLLLGCGGVAIGIVITGNVPISLTELPMLFLSMTIGCLCIMLCQLQIGYAAAWVSSSAPIFWIWQKLFFVLGGLMIPLTLYPPLLRRISELTPFAAMLNTPGSLIFPLSATATISLVTQQILWLTALAALTWTVDRALTARFALRGI